MTRVLVTALYVGIGGFAGSIIRYLLTLGAQKFSLVFPYGTLGANLGGCFLIGGLVQLMGQSAALSPEVSLLLMTGFCGGFTTMSSMINEMAQFIEADAYLQAGGYLILTVGGSMLAFYLGALAMQWFLRSTAGIWD